MKKEYTQPIIQIYSVNPCTMMSGSQVDDTHNTIEQKSNAYSGSLGFEDDVQDDNFGTTNTEGY